MNREVLVQCRRRIPFRPVRIHLSSGKFYDVLEPEHLGVGVRTVYIVVDGGPGAEVDSVAEHGIEEVMQIEPLEPAGTG